MSSQEIIAGQATAIEPEVFQARLIERIVSALHRDPSPPCLLRAPTGAGKTFVIGRVLEDVCELTSVLWFWFVPFATLVQQTEDSIASHCLTLAPTSLVRGRNKEPASRMVLVSTAQAVAKATARKTGYRGDADDDVRSLADLVDRGRAKGLKIGLVVDEAHIGLDSQTEFGQFAKWLRPDLLLMASATPKDQRLVDFLASAGFGGYESFTVSRDEVVGARLNKKYIEAVVYDLRMSMRTITDLQQTVLRQAWRRNQRIKKILQSHQIAVVPLLLVQVANGVDTVDKAKEQLISLCKVPPHAIGEHSADEPNPVLMAAIANDTTKEVLIFKQSAGTGFDAPRAFVLASTKPVNDADFAVQFIGRVMRVTQSVRAAFPRRTVIPPELDTAYIYLANAQAQQGFEQAVQATSQLKSQLEGQTEKLVAQQMASGALVYRNRDTDQPPLLYATEIPAPVEVSAVPERSAAAPQPNVASTGDGVSGSLFDADDALDTVAPHAQLVRSSANRYPPKKRAELLRSLETAGIRIFARTERGQDAPMALKREKRPEMADMSAITHAAATKLNISDELKANAVRAALDRVREREIHTELTSGERKEEEVAVVTDRGALAREAMSLLRALPQVEDEDARIIIDVLTKRLQSSVDEQYEDVEDDVRPPEKELRLRARDAAYWVIRREADSLAELLYYEIAAQAVIEDAAPLPDFMTFPLEVGLEPSARNIFGVLPPSTADIEQVAQVLTVDVRDLVVKDHQVLLEDGSVLTGSYDGSSALNAEEREFAKALDRAAFVKWWHRNPDRKAYSVRVVRGEHKNYFYPDFVVCVEHFPGDVPVERLIETKENVKDAARKSKHVPDHYGRVLFLTKDQKRLRIVNADGSLGEAVDLDDPLKVREWLRESRPVAGG